MLERSDSHSNQHTESHQGARVPLDRSFELTASGDFCTVSSCLPEPSDIGSGSAGIGVDEVSGSNGASQVGALRQVSTLILGGKEGSVSAGCCSTPGGELLAGGEKRQRPAGIDALDGTKRDVDGSKDIHQSNLFFTDLNPGVMKTSPNQKGHQCCGGDAHGNTPESALQVAGKKSQQHDQANNPGDDLAKTGSKDLHVNNDSLATGVFA